jgi:hypothetical protein
MEIYFEMLSYVKNPHTSNRPENIPAFFELFICLEGRGCSVGVQFPEGTRNILKSVTTRLTLGPTQPPIYWVLGALSLGVKRSGHKDDHSLPSSARAKSSRAIPPLPHTNSWRRV